MWTKITEDKATWPPCDDTVSLLCDRNGNVYAGCGNVTKKSRLTLWVFDPDDGALTYIGEAATHWMPLPQPPAE